MENKQKSAPINDKDVFFIIDMHLKGFDYETIADRNGVSVSSVRHYCTIYNKLKRGEKFTDGMFAHRHDKIVAIANKYGFDIPQSPAKEPEQIKLDIEPKAEPSDATAILFRELISNQRLILDKMEDIADIISNKRKNHCRTCGREIPFGYIHCSACNANGTKKEDK